MREVHEIFQPKRFSRAFEASTPSSGFSTFLPVNGARAGFMVTIPAAGVLSIRPVGYVATGSTTALNIVQFGTPWWFGVEDMGDIITQAWEWTFSGGPGTFMVIEAQEFV